jgi:hypothetical protein
MGLKYRILPLAGMDSPVNILVCDVALGVMSCPIFVSF